MFVSMNIASVKSTGRHSFSLITPYRTFKWVFYSHLLQARRISYYHFSVLYMLCLLLGGLFSFSADSAKEATMWLENLNDVIRSALSYSEVAHRLWSNPSNKVCADCGAANPEWASVNLLVVICEACAGAHRSMSSNRSKVRGLKLDNKVWTEPLIQVSFVMTKKRVILSACLYDVKWPVLFSIHFTMLWKVVFFPIPPCRNPLNCDIGWVSCNPLQFSLQYFSWIRIWILTPNICVVLLPLPYYVLVITDSAPHSACWATRNVSTQKHSVLVWLWLLGFLKGILRSAGSVEVLPFLWRLTDSSTVGRVVGLISGFRNNNMWHVVNRLGLVYEGHPVCGVSKGVLVQGQVLCLSAGAPASGSSTSAG